MRPNETIKIHFSRPRPFPVQSRFEYSPFLDFHEIYARTVTINVNNYNIEVRYSEGNGLLSTGLTRFLSIYKEIGEHFVKTLMHTEDLNKMSDKKFFQLLENSIVNGFKEVNPWA